MNIETLTKRKRKGEEHGDTWLSVASGTRTEGNSARSSKSNLSSDWEQRKAKQWRLSIWTAAETSAKLYFHYKNKRLSTNLYNSDKLCIYFHSLTLGPVWPTKPASHMFLRHSTLKLFYFHHKLMGLAHLADQAHRP